MENEVYEVEMTLGNDEKVKMNVEVSQDWDEIKEGTRALLILINGQQMLVRINHASLEDVSFKLIDGERSYGYDAEMVSEILVEVE